LAAIRSAAGSILPQSLTGSPGVKQTALTAISISIKIENTDD
jgi:hypothetical protein